jgi:FMN phosphatase YigB (HAD superfamily)
MQVFVSYAFSDEEIMKRLCRELKEYEIETYVAVHDIGLGEPLPNKIEEAIQKSDAIVVLLTRNSATSPSVNQELAFAKAKGIRIIPVVENGVKVGVLLQGLKYVDFEREKIPQVSKKIAESLLKERKGIPESKPEERVADIEYYYEIARNSWNNMVDRENAVDELKRLGARRKLMELANASWMNDSIRNQARKALKSM